MTSTIRGYSDACCQRQISLSRKRSNLHKPQKWLRRTLEISINRPEQYILFARSNRPKKIHRAIIAVVSTQHTSVGSKMLNVVVVARRDTWLERVAANQSHNSRAEATSSEVGNVPRRHITWVTRWMRTPGTRIQCSKL